MYKILGKYLKRRVADLKDNEYYTVELKYPVIYVNGVEYVMKLSGGERDTDIQNNWDALEMTLNNAGEKM